MTVEVILLEKIRNLGALGAKVKVKPGFARNYLVPQGKAVYANKDNIIKFEQRRVELERIAAERHQKATERCELLSRMNVVVITAKAGDEGKLFGSVGVRDIMEALQKTGAPVEKREIRLPEGALRLLGEYDIVIELESDVTATIKVRVIAEG